MRDINFRNLVADELIEIVKLNPVFKQKYDIDPMFKRRIDAILEEEYNQDVTMTTIINIIMALGDVLTLMDNMIMKYDPKLHDKINKEMIALLN